jgi:arylsulfatase A-like enzyme
MNRRQFLSAGAGFAAAMALGGCATTSAAVHGRKPNVILIFTDDQGFADLSCQGQLPDIRTPNIDRLATEGVRFTDGYITAPQCSPSRAGLLTGRYQQRFGFDHIPDCPLPSDEITIADRMREAGYATGMVGKWHLEPNILSKAWADNNPGQATLNERGHVVTSLESQLPYFPQNRGFTEFFKGEMHRYWANYALDGGDLDPGGEWVEDKRFRIDVQSDAAVSFIERNHAEPFFLHLAYFAPHTPLEATPEYLEAFPGDMPERRRHALAMTAAMDRGVGRILDTLERHGIDEDTLIIYTSDNGAPLKITMEDSPVNTDPGGWDGSRNDPFVGEKGMLAEGGIRVPFVARWKGTLPEGMVCKEPVISLDIAATALAAAGREVPPELDGVNLIPHLTGKEKDAPPRALFWRFWNQAAVRKGDWKYLHLGNRGRFLFNLSTPEHEHVNLIEQHPDKARELRADLEQWAGTLTPPGLPDGKPNNQENAWYAHYFGLEPEP